MGCSTTVFSTENLCWFKTTSTGGLFSLYSILLGSGQFPSYLAWKGREERHISPLQNACYLPVSVSGVGGGNPPSFYISPQNMEHLTFSLVFKGTVAWDGLMSWYITSQKVIRDLKIFWSGSTTCWVMDNFEPYCAYAIEIWAHMPMALRWS